MRKADKYRVGGIYKITNTTNNKCYIGSAVYIKSRWARHRTDLRKGCHANKHFQSAWNMYGEKSFIFEVIEECSLENIVEREQYYLNTLKPEYNILLTAKSSIGLKHTQKTKDKLSQIFKGRAPSNKGKPRSEETILKLKEAWKIRKLTPVSEGTKRKISKALKGKKKTKEHTEKVKLSKLKKKITKNEHIPTK